MRFIRCCEHYRGGLLRRHQHPGAARSLPSPHPTITQHYLANGVKQRVVSDFFCGSTVEKVFAADSSLSGSRRVRSPAASLHSLMGSMARREQRRLLCARWTGKRCGTGCTGSMPTGSRVRPKRQVPGAPQRSRGRRWPNSGPSCRPGLTWPVTGWCAGAAATLRG